MATGEHKLYGEFTLWCTNDRSIDWSKKDEGKKKDALFDDAVKQLGNFSTAEGFWANYKYLARPDDLEPKRAIEYHCFRTGIKPIWEDPANESGGEWVLRLRKGGASRVWEDLLMAVLGGEFGVDGEVCGVVISVKPQEDKVALWHRSRDNKEVVARLKKKMREVLRVPEMQPSPFVYKNHSANIRIFNRKLNDDGSEKHSAGGTYFKSGGYGRSRKGSYKKGRGGSDRGKSSAYRSSRSKPTAPRSTATGRE